MSTTTSPHRPAAALRWAPVLSATYAQATAFASAAVLAFLIGDVSAAFGAGAGTRLWPLAAFALGLVAAANSARRTGPLGPARWTGSGALAGLTLTALAAALVPNFAFMLVTALLMGSAAGLVIAVSGRVLVEARVGDGNGSTALSALAVLAGVSAAVGGLFALPWFGWRGVFGLLVVAAVMATWKFAEHIPPE
ncbi:hypothetical protein GCM10027447_05310 [Glycomyces halotolerans]